VQLESRLDRSLWTIVLLVAVGLVIANFAQRPLFGRDSEASGFGHPLTLWVTGGESDSQSRAVARQVAACWQLGGRPVSVGVLPGSSTAAVADFLRIAHRAPDELLLITSTTFADLARDERAAPGSETRERAQQTARLLTQAPPVSLLGSDPLTLAVSSSAHARTTGQLLALMRERPAEPFIGIAEDSWLEGNLAELAQIAGVQGRLPFDTYRSSRLALASLSAGEIGVVLAQRSSVARATAEGRVRMLPWPGASAPHGWDALLAPRGLGAAQIGALRRQASASCPSGTWQRLLRADGLAPARSGSVPGMSFVHEGLDEASRLQALAARIVRGS
jgi:hypothetical protein